MQIYNHTPAFRYPLLLIQHLRADPLVFLLLPPHHRSPPPIVSLKRLCFIAGGSAATLLASVSGYCYTTRRTAILIRSTTTSPAACTFAHRHTKTHHAFFPSSASVGHKSARENPTIFASDEWRSLPLDRSVKMKVRERQEPFNARFISMGFDTSPEQLRRVCVCVCMKGYRDGYSRADGAAWI